MRDIKSSVMPGLGLMPENTAVSSVERDYTHDLEIMENVPDRC